MIVVVQFIDRCGYITKYVVCVKAHCASTITVLLNALSLQLKIQIFQIGMSHQVSYRSESFAKLKCGNLTRTFGEFLLFISNSLDFASLMYFYLL